MCKSYSCLQGQVSILREGMSQDCASSCLEAEGVYLCDSLCPRDIQITIEKTIMPTNNKVTPYNSATLHAVFGQIPRTDKELLVCFTLLADMCSMQISARPVESCVVSWLADDAGGGGGDGVPSGFAGRSDMTEASLCSSWRLLRVRHKRDLVMSACIQPPRAAQHV